MKDYYKILEIQQFVMSAKARHNAYIKIAIRTNDDKLKELIQDRLNKRQLAFEELRKHCLTQIENQTPAWQVAAKKAGWSES